MAMMMGIKAGESRSRAAGATQPTVSLSVSADGATAVIGDRRVVLTGATLVVWHDSDAGTWHGLQSPVTLRTERVSSTAPTPARAIELGSSSGGADVAAVVAVIPPEGVAVVTSGYKGRGGWRLRVVDAEGAVVFDGSPVDYRAGFAPAGAL